MAENIPNVPGGAMPPKPAEAAKVQPKKETVRITLPPKPTAAPTVKLPSLTPTAAPPPAAAPAAAAPAAPPTSAGPTLAPRPGQALASPPTSAGRGPATKAPPRPAPATARSSGLDSFLAIVVGIVALAAAGVVYFLFTLANIEY